MKLFVKAGELYEKSIGGSISDNDLDEIIAWPIEDLPLLFAAADRVRRRFFGNTVNPCTLMNIKSGGCSEDCAFCSQSTHHATGVPVTPLAPPDNIRKLAETAARNGLPFCVVASGRRLDREEVKKIADALAPCSCEKHASLGILDKEDFALLIKAGVVCYNHNIETSRSFFPSVVTTHTYDDRIATVKKAKNAGMRVCCGGILGLGETWEHRKEMCLELKNLDVDTVPINFLNAVPGTRVKPPQESPFEFLKIVSLFRLALPSKTIKVCGGREINLGVVQALMFHAGANGYVTGGYLTTPGAGLEADDAMIKKLGLSRNFTYKK
ncbi:MAG: biotin synthase BioB [Chitinispirillaceae bacterium]|nr:biotin synthase BioB [Chitinispirillaceae bacterium]